jgi:xanthine dehydrogenase accessory factor
MVNYTPSDLEILNEASRLLEKRKIVALCTVVEKKGSGPRDIGAKMLVSEEGKNFGTIGGGNVERALIDECLKAMKEHKSKKVTFNLNKSSKKGTVGTAMICGGELTVLMDVMEPVPRLVIVGTGHVALPLAKLASNAGFKIVIVDDERKLANKDQFPMAETIIAGDYARILSEFELTPHDSVVIAHGEPEHDYAALKGVIEKNASYVGLLGSRTKASILTERLRREGVDEVHVNALHAPLGLDIGAETPEEIGVSILAQIIQFKRQRQE